MNVKNNRRRQQSQEKIEAVFVQLLQTKELAQITVSDICKRAELNRSTFYANYADVYALADTIRERLFCQVNELYEHDIANRYYGDSCVRLLHHIQDNPLFYATYFKLGYDNEHVVDLGELQPENRIFPEEHLAYHVEFFKAGFNAMVKKWLRGGCRETPEEMAEILRSEYRGRY